MFGLTGKGKFFVFVIIAVIATVILAKTGLLQKGVDKVTASSATSTVAARSGKLPKIDGKKPLHVCLNTWSGWAPGIVYNGGLKASETSRFYTEQGIPVQFTIVDNFDAARAGFKSGQFDMLWTTYGEFSTEVLDLMEVNARAWFQADWSDGGDVAIVVEDIKTINDLRGRSVAVAVPSPSTGLLNDMLKAGGMTIKDINLVKADDAAMALAMFKAGKVDAAIVWSPDDQDGLKAVPRSHVLVSSRGKKIIADGFYVKQEFIESHRNELEAFATGWLIAAAELNGSSVAKDKAAEVLAVAFNMPAEFCRIGLDNARFCTLGDNIQFFNINGDATGVTGEKLYTSGGVDYARLDLAPAVLPAWRNVTDTSIIRALQESGKLAGPEQMAEGGPKFSKPTAQMASAPAFSTKRATVSFPSGSATLDAEAKSTIDREFAEIAAKFANSRIRIEGNTDDVGGDGINVPLSRRRAQAVADYLIQTYHFSPHRFVVVGNGSGQPIGDNSTIEGRAANRRTDFELLEEATASR